MATTYKIGEAATLLNLKTYVLRFWETEFPDIVPLRTDKGQRLYTEENLALLERIRFLLHERGLTIEGARKVLSEDKEKGVTYVFAPDAGPRPAPLDEPAPESGPEPENEPEPDAELPAAVEENPDFPEGSNNALSAAGTAVKNFFSQYNLPGISKTYPIHERPLFERPEPFHGNERRPERPADSPRRETADNDAASSESPAAPPKDHPARLESEPHAMLQDLAVELEDIVRLLRND